MLKFITDFLDAKNKRKREKLKILKETVEQLCKIISKATELKMIHSQNKCIGCEHTFKKTYKKGGIVRESGREVIINVGDIMEKFESSESLKNLLNKRKKPNE